MAMKKINDFNVVTTCLSVLIATLFSTSLFAQSSNDTSKSNATSNGDDIGQQMFDNSRPGEYHQLLADLVGTWTFEGRRFPLNPDSIKVKFDFFGSHIRKSFAEGRYFIVDMTMGDSLHKVLIPIEGGKIKEVIGKGIAIEGYDNVKKKFVQAYITNHIGSDIAFWEGPYDSITKTITLNAEQEIVPGIKDKIRQLFIIQDKDHYTIEYYNEEGGRYVKNTEVNFTRVK
jgi:hypothetical protein